MLRQAESYLRGLFSQVDRKNIWQLAEATGAVTPHGFQRLLGRARWDADAVRDDLRHYVAKHLGDPEGVMAPGTTDVTRWYFMTGVSAAGALVAFSGVAALTQVRNFRRHSVD